MLSDIVDELKEALEHQSVTKNEEEKRVLREKKKQLKELERHRDKLMEYDNRYYISKEVKFYLLYLQQHKPQ